MSLETPHDPGNLVRQYFGLLSGAPIERAEAILADRFVFSHPPLTPAGGSVGRAAFLTNILGPTRAAFPDMTFQVHALLVEGDAACARWTMMATHRGPYMGVTATENAVRVNGINIFHTSDGRIGATWVARDNVGLLRQLGVSL